MRASGCVRICVKHASDCSKWKPVIAEYPDHVWEFAPMELWRMYQRHGDAEYREVGNYHVVECQKQ